MAYSSTELMTMIEKRVSNILNSEKPKQELEIMFRLQQEHSPHLTQTEAEDYVIQGLVQTYNDHELDHLWYQFKNLKTLINEEAA